MHSLPKIIFVLSCVVSFIGCDQATKSIAKHELRMSPSIEYLGGIVHFQYAENEGSFLGFGSGLPAPFRKSLAIALTVAVMVGFVGLLLYADRLMTLNLVAYSILIAGALGNLIDRLLNQGRVIDFLVLGTDAIHTGIFNVADVLLMSGIFLFLVSQLHRRSLT